MIEGIDQFVDHGTGVESTLKFWLPKFFPSRIRFILTAQPDSATFNYLKRQECKVIMMHSFDNVFSSILDAYRKRKFAMAESHVDTVFYCLKKKLMAGEIQDSLFLKSAIACLSPYETASISELEGLKLDAIKDTISKFGLYKLIEIKTTEDLLREVVVYYEKKLMDPSVYKKILVCLSLTSQGLKQEEIINFVE